MKNFCDPSTPVAGCLDCGELISPDETLCGNCELRMADPVLISAWPIMCVLAILSLGSALLIPLIFIYWQIWRG